MNSPSNIAIKYTDEIYATKAQVRKSSGMILFDSYWDEIESYRESNKVILPFGKINSSSFFVTMTEPIKAKISTFEGKIKDFLTLTRNVLLDSGKKDAQLILLTPLLESAALLEKSTINDLSIKMLINSLYSENNASHAPIVNYCSSLKYYLDASPLLPNDDFLAGAYQRLLGQEELTDFYRFNDFGLEARISNLRFVVDPDYPFAPHDMIDDLMESFLTWANEEELPFFVRACLAVYYVNYIKPFKEKNALIASLLAKDIVSYSTSLKEGFVLPFENLLKSDFNNLESIKEAKSKGDMTYLIFEAISNLSLYIDSLTLQLNKLRISPYKDDFTKLSVEEEKIAEKIEEKKTIVEPTQLSFFDNVPESEPKEEKQAEKEPLKEEVKPTAIEQEKPTPKPILKEETKIPQEEEKEIKRVEALTIEAPTKEAETLSKSEIKDYIRYLLETNPNLNKKQASFLANHNTPGRYYTIQQFKDHAHCVYETARTSMDKLASEGYYEKLQFKNKFVYSPKKKGK